VAILTHQNDVSRLSIPQQRDNADRSGMNDNLLCPNFAIGVGNLVHANLNVAAIENDF
jgi:hypothetical protein